MKLKFLVAAIGLIVSAASQAQIVTPSTSGGSDLLLDVWEQGVAGAPDQSFTLNLGQTMTQFLASDTSSSTLATVLANDTTWTSFLASSSDANLQWSVIASGNKVPTRAGLLATVTAGEDAVGLGLTNNNAISGNVQLASTVDNMNVQATPNEQVNTVASNAYYQTATLSNFNGNAWDNGNALGATGVQVATLLNVGGSTAATGATALLKGTMSFAQDGTGNYVLNYNVAAVPEASGFAVMLAGLGALTLLARRRKGL